MEITAKNINETKKVAAGLIGRVLKEKKTVICLKGELGAGKTIFAQGLGRALGIKKRILSPTFVLINRYKIKKNGFDNFFHFDCYRIDSYKEIAKLGFKEIISNPRNIICIEWPEKIKNILPKEYFLVNILIKDQKTRIIKIVWKQKATNF